MNFGVYTRLQSPRIYYSRESNQKLPTVLPRGFYFAGSELEAYIYVSVLYTRFEASWVLLAVKWFNLWLNLCMRMMIEAHSGGA